MFRLDAVSKRYGDLVAIDEVDLAVAPSQTTALIGPSGSGKSTLLRMMVGLVWPDQGAVSFDGETLHPARIESVRRRLGYMIQDGGLFPHLTALGNVALMARHLGWTPDRIVARADELADLTRFPRDGLDRFPGELSGGQQQRVSLMRALFLDPSVLLLDEPLGALDPMIRYELQQELAAVFDELETTVVLVTHDLAEADFFADEIVLMRQGRIAQRGTLSTFRDDPADDFVTHFVEAQRGRA